MRNEKGQFVAAHGARKTKLYRVWCSMKERCSNPHHKSFKHYGLKGITVCGEWISDFAEFQKWSKKNGYHEGLTIDRIDTSKGYNPSNCRWVGYKVQNRNYSRNRNITFNGKTQCVTDWADELGINRTTILFRLKQGKSLEEVFNKEDGRKSRWKTILKS